MDIICGMTSGSLFRSHLPAQQPSGLQFEERLMKIPAEVRAFLERETQAVEIFTRNGCWIVTPEFAQYWTRGLVNGIISRRIWVIQNGEVWQVEGTEIRAGDVIRIMGPTPPGLPVQALSSYDFSHSQLGRVCWSSWTKGQIP
jgi:hypothetical protein